MKLIKQCLRWGMAAVFTAALVAAGQTPPNLGIQLYAGLNVAGTTGSVYTIQFTSNLALSNSWSSLAFVQLPVTNYLWVDTTTPAAQQRFYRALLMLPPTNMVYIPPGTFLMGSPTNEVGHLTNESPQTLVTLTHGFWMNKFLVTQAEYLSVMSNNPSSFTGDLMRPVETVSFLDASNYCVMLTQRELAAGRIPPGTQYRLPTEAEWEYAARAGTSTRFYYGDDPNLSDVTNHAWTGFNSGFMTHPVGQKPPNPWGLYDMEGNVFEWTHDWFTGYPGGFAIDPQGPPATFDFLSMYKAIRGGAFDYTEFECRSASRLIYAVGPSLRDYDLGFRVVLAIGPP